MPGMHPVLVWHAPSAQQGQESSCLSVSLSHSRLLLCAPCAHPTQERHQVPAAQLSTCVAQVHRRHSLPQVGCSTLYPLPSTLLRVSCAVLPKLLYNSKSKFTCRLRCPEAAVLVAANQDAYVSRQSVIELAEHWPGCEVRWVEGGHVSAFLMQQPAFRTAILDSLNRLPKDP